MILAVDTHYTDKDTCTAGVLFAEWGDSAAAGEHVVMSAAAEAYAPGEFYKRELPCILDLLKTRDLKPETIVVDGYVYLDGMGRKGLGAYLYDALERDITVIGVAKTAFQGSPHARAVLRGESERPLYVTAAGVDVGEAADLIERMHGPHRTPTLLKRVDTLCRRGVGGA